MAAFAVALQRYATNAPFDEVRELAAWLRPQLRALGRGIVVDDAHANPAVTTLALPKGTAERMGDALAARGFLVSYQSGYLQQRDWLQICLMGDHDRARTARLVTAMTEILAAGAGRTAAASG